MKVLFYFKTIDVYSPSSGGFSGGGGDRKEMDPNQTLLQFSVFCIEQIDPETKLKELYRNKKLPPEITKFVERFEINELTKSKSEW